MLAQPRLGLLLVLTALSLTCQGCLSSTSYRLGVDARRGGTNPSDPLVRLPQVTVIGLYQRKPLWPAGELELLPAEQLPGDGVGVLEYPSRIYYTSALSAQPQEYRPEPGAIALADGCWPVVVQPGEQGPSLIEWYDENQPGRLDGMLRLTFAPMTGPQRLEQPQDIEAVLMLFDEYLDDMITAIRSSNLPDYRKSQLLSQLLTTTQNLAEIDRRAEHTVILDRAQQRIGRAMSR